jgi:hypothetical protein
MDEKAVRDWVQFVLVLFAAGFGIYQFIWKERIVPTMRPATLAVTPTLYEVGRKENMALIRATVHAVNRSDSKIYVPAFWFNAWGVRLEMDEQSDAIRQSNESQSSARYSRQLPGDLLATWRMVALETYYEPGDETTNDELFLVPADKYDAVQLRAEMYLTRKINPLAPTAWDVGADGSLQPTLMFKRPGFDNDPSLTEAFDAETKRDHRLWEKRHGTGANWSMATLSLWPEKAGTVSQSPVAI